jgi:hypothetical protein
VLCCVALYLKIHTCRRRKKRMLNLWSIGDVLLLQVCLDLVLLDQLATSGINIYFLFFVALLHNYKVCYHGYYLAFELFLRICIGASKPACKIRTSFIQYWIFSTPFHPITRHMERVAWPKLSHIRSPNGS